MPTSHGGACLPPTEMEPGSSLRMAPHHPPRCSRTFRFVGMWRVLEPALAAISLERIGRPFADIGERDATHNNGRGYVGRSMARSMRRLLLRQPSGGATLASRSSKEERLAHLLRCLFYFEALYQFELRGFHIPGTQNRVADALSRNHIDVFFQQVPGADTYPHPIPSHLGWWKRC